MFALSLCSGYGCIVHFAAAWQPSNIQHHLHMPSIRQLPSKNLLWSNQKNWQRQKIGSHSAWRVTCAVGPKWPIGGLTAWAKMAMCQCGPMRFELWPRAPEATANSRRYRKWRTCKGNAWEPEAAANSRSYREWKHARKTYENQKPPRTPEGTVKWKMQGNTWEPETTETYQNMVERSRNIPKQVREELKPTKTLSRGAETYQSRVERSWKSRSRNTSRSSARKLSCTRPPCEWQCKVNRKCCCRMGPVRHSSMF